MSATLVEYLGDEPLMFEDVAAQCRLDSEAERTYIESVLIPAARKLAEQKTGAAVRRARDLETFPWFPATLSLPLGLGQVTKVEQLRYRSVLNGEVVWDAAAYRLTQGGRASWVEPVGDGWPMTARGSDAVRIDYTAGIDLSKHPALKQWLLLACAWLFEQRELYVVGQAQPMPGSFADTLLAEITLAPSF